MTPLRPVALLRRITGLVHGLSIRIKALAAIGFLLVCLAAVGLNSYATMKRTSARLHELETDTLTRQTLAMQMAQDIVATHMKLFRFVTLASNGLGKDILRAIYTDTLADLKHEENRLAAFAAGRRSETAEDADLEAIRAKWATYAGGAKDLMDVGMSDPAMAVMMLRSTDEDFQAIAEHLAMLSSRMNYATASVVSEGAASADGSARSLLIGGTAGMLLSVLVAMLFVRSLVRPLQAVTRAMNEIFLGTSRVKLGYEHRKDEIGQMVRAVSTFHRTMRLHLETIEAQRRRFNAALSNMSQGLCMFSADGTLTVFNGRLLEIYGLPAGSIEPGFTLEETLKALAQAGSWTSDQEQYVSDLHAALVRDGSVRMTRMLNDGRVIHGYYETLAGGGWISTHEDVTERIRNEERVAFLARNDSLTGLPNRHEFRERTEEFLIRAKRGEKFALMCVDLDQFKEVNDTLGHPSGDVLLKQVAARLRATLRQTDMVARLGGDEFAIVQTSVYRPEKITVLASRIVKTLSEPYDIDGHEVVVGASIGIAIAPDDGLDADQLLRNADMALYRAKAEGRGTYRFFEAEMDARLQARRKLELDLRKALPLGELEVFYQPIVNVDTGCVASFEALLRWNHPERGMVMPGEFIPVAEDIGLISQIGEWVLAEACRAAAGWPGETRVAVNLSPSQFRKGLVPAVVTALAGSGLIPQRLELEITESVLLQNTEATIATLHQLHQLGVRIAMDDFGTGYSSLSYLHSFPFDKIKIDRSFVAALGTHTECAAIVRAVTGLGQSLGIKTTAEGVETQEQFEWLRAEGCSEAQGYLFSRALPAAQVPALIVDMASRRAA